MSQYGQPKQKDTRVLIVCALAIETQNQLDDYDVLYTGVGKVNATYELTTHFGKIGSHIPYDLVINYGTAGSRKIKKKTLVDCTKFIQRDMDVTGLGFMRGETPFELDPPLMLDFGITKYNTIGRRATCGSGDNFVEDKTNYYGEVVDMEAYALAKVCYLRDVPFVSFKYITDGADEQAHEDWEANLADGIEVFKDKVLSEIKR
ncbi:5'-methylthioadenosine/S-adenosylhomocysteine nucleosidase [Candidatus Woesearchaeota archaeon]|jgi:adenosylhomocysteine nucleosidase|nr:5'-methylthioadenosine/S-adenosylhomocysteine nucleosidase [Candidatus Woesearchaeota archaeon]|tara:strand:- start:365 stop:976 length:612 start_codon:yes stop_codon:yes gene_type:complete